MVTYFKEKTIYKAERWNSDESCEMIQPFDLTDTSLEPHSECSHCNQTADKHGITSGNGPKYLVCPGNWVIYHNGFKQVITENELKKRFEEIIVDEAE